MRHASLKSDRTQRRSRWNSRAFTARRLASLIILFCFWIVAAHAQPGSPLTGGVAPAVSIIIDDLGHRLDQDLRAISLDGAVTCAFLPRSPHARRLATLAHARGKEIMLHMPMQAVGGQPLDDGGLSMTMSRRQFAELVHEGLQAIPHVRGVNNHMGSLLTQYPARMQWLMEELKQYNGRLYFVDSFTTFQSVAYTVAADNRLPSIRRDIFLDNRRDPAYIAYQFELLIQRARENGTAVAIGHPHPETMSFLEANLDRLEALGIELLPVSELIARRQELNDPRGGVVLAADRWSAENRPKATGVDKLAN